jgi:hypothetical protein
MSEMNCFCMETLEKAALNRVLVVLIYDEKVDGTVHQTDIQCALLIHRPITTKTAVRILETPVIQPCRGLMEGEATSRELVIDRSTGMFCVEDRVKPKVRPVEVMKGVELDNHSGLDGCLLPSADDADLSTELCLRDVWIWQAEKGSATAFGATALQITKLMHMQIQPVEFETQQQREVDSHRFMTAGIHHKHSRNWPPLCLQMVSSKEQMEAFLSRVRTFLG